MAYCRNSINDKKKGLKMKWTKFILSICFSLIVSALATPVIANWLEISPAATFGVLSVVQFVPLGRNGIAMAGVYREVWTKAVKANLSTAENASFLEGIEDFSQYVKDVGNESQVIHITYMGVEPDVLINNTTYPIPDQVLEGEDVPMPLDKYQTKRTPVSDDELYALSYDKIGAVKRRHAKAIIKYRNKKAIHSIAPGNNTVKMPVLVTTGKDDGTGRKRLTLNDIVNLKQKLDDLEVPEQGRRLVLCTDHVNDLLLLDQAFKQQYYNYTDGKIANMFGFEIYSYVAMPYFNPATKTKLSFGAVPNATDRKASVFFSMERVVKANGWVKMYYSEAKQDPATQANHINFRHYFIVMPILEEARGAIVSDNA